MIENVGIKEEKVCLTTSNHKNSKTQKDKHINIHPCPISLAKEKETH